MSSVSPNYYREGDTTSATTINNDYTNIATASGQISSENIRSEGTGRIHYEKVAPNGVGAPVHSTFAACELYSNTTGIYSSTSFVPVSHGTPIGVGVGSGGAELLFARTVNENNVLRLQGNMYIIDGENDQLNTDPVNFTFRFEKRVGGVWSAIDATDEFMYSLWAKEPGAGAETKYYRRRVGFSMIYIHRGANVTIERVRIAVKMELDGSIRIGYYTFLTTCIEH